MVRKLSVLLGAAGLAMPLVLVAAPAHADVIWQTGQEVTHQPELNWPTTRSWLGACDSDPESFAQVKTHGDYVFVKDTCADGRSAMAQVITYDEAGESVRHRYCRNPHGKGTWAKCNFNWPEEADGTCDPLACGYNMVLVAGSYNGNTGHLRWDHGNTEYFYD